MSTDVKLLLSFIGAIEIFAAFTLATWLTRREIRAQQKAQRKLSRAAVAVIFVVCLILSGIAIMVAVCLLGLVGSV
jgi:heme/copper-type cytochrome/quinol oxidase subunit 3